MQQEGPDLHVYRSANLVRTLLKRDLVDACSWRKAPHLPTEGRYGPRDMWATSRFRRGSGDRLGHKTSSDSRRNENPAQASLERGTGHVLGLDTPL